MKRNIDSRHLAFHVLVALYFIWAIVFSALIGMGIADTGGPDVSVLLANWLLVNLVMGSVLYVVIKMFRSATVIVKAIRVSYFVLASLSIIVQIILRA